ncbi:Golgi phosphoprotein 3 GPP34 [Micromonospora sp. Llam0]|nr:Golgi phosphoprotein 3 GPP34 [Micromonospora sp. Llam0]
MSLPGGRRLLADEFFLMAHHDVSGRLRLAPRIAGLGVAAALVIDLAVTGALVVTPTGQLVRTSVSVPADVWEWRVLGWVAAEPGQPVATWIDFLADQSVEAVGERLAAAGVVRRVRVRRLLKTPRIAWEPADMNVAAWPWARLSTRIRRSERLEAFDSCLARLSLATGIEGRFLDGESAQARQRLEQLLSPVSLQLDGLLRQLSAAVGRAVLGGRT